MMFFDQQRYNDVNTAEKFRMLKNKYLEVFMFFDQYGNEQRDFIVAILQSLTLIEMFFTRGMLDTIEYFPGILPTYLDLSVNTLYVAIGCCNEMEIAINHISPVSAA